jgi:MFS family permease
MMAVYPRQYVSRLVPSNRFLILALIVATSAVDSTVRNLPTKLRKSTDVSQLLGYDSSLMGSSYFTLNTVTKSLNTAVSYSGGAVCAPFAGLIVDWRGRRESIFWSCFVTLVGAVIQSAAQNIGMFIAGRFIIGLGLGLAATATPTYVAETCPPKHRGFALGLYYACWGVGTLIASGVCYGVRMSLRNVKSLRFQHSDQYLRNLNF